MAENSKIQWTDHTFNPWWGCSKVSPGCTNCYAETFSRRTGADLWGTGKARRRTGAANWREPVKWNREAAKTFGICTTCNDPVVVEGMGVECGCGIYGTAPKTRRPRVFCASMADWLDDAVPVEWLADLLVLIASTPHLDWLLLTKRPENWRTRILSAPLHPLRHIAADVMVREWLAGTPPANVWLGTTVEDQRRADERIPALLSIPAIVRFLSCEPLLEALDLGDSLVDLGPEINQHSPRINWVIVGGESGGGARVFDLAWARSIRDQCAEARVACFVKQMGAKPRCSVDSVPPADWYWPKYHDRHGGDWSEWPADMRVRQFPEE